MTEYEKRAVCPVCPHHCSLKEGQYGRCRARKNEKGKIICVNYGRITALALDPVEKKPLRHFFPGSMILSAGSYGCNLSCPFCQNYQISMAGSEEKETAHYVTDEAAAGVPDFREITPEELAELAEDLRGAGYDFRLKLIGGGELEEKLKARIREKELSGLVTMTGFLPPQEVRKAMEESHIFLFTSNHLEGWGAVVNEAMNSRCAVVASREAGAVPFLIRHGENGMVYYRNRYEDFSGAVRHLIENKKDRERMGQRACETILKEWNADTAAARCLSLYEGWEKGRMSFPESGPLSPAPMIRP